VIAALAAVLLAPEHPGTRLVDLGGSLAVALYLLATALGTARASTGGGPAVRSARSASADDDGVGAGEHPLGEVAVEVGRDADRDLGADELTKKRDEVALPQGHPS
jgi:hypothetical protein